ncbi:hypothetical protein TPDSL_17760 [Terrisporobacter petrolearius]|uniref:hypothetical protein n=1 Tax=Terrisporobacter petrolearius TaxID=1460447 RepID=UPI0033698E05
MKKLLSLMLVLIMSLTVACNKSEKKVEQTQEVNETQETKERFSMTEKGDCKFYITTSETLTSENGAIPYIYLEDENTLMQIGYDARDFDSSKLSYIYIDGELVSKESISEEYQSTLNLEKNSIKYGKHKVEVVQYKSSESENKEDVEVYKVAQYVVTNDDSEFTKGNEECKKQMKLKSDQKEDKKESEETKEDAQNQGVVYKSDNSNKTSKKSSSSKSNTSSKKSENKNESNKKGDDKLPPGGYYVTCPECGRQVYTINGDWDCGCYDDRYDNVDDNNSNNYDEGDNSNNNSGDEE